MVRSKPWIIIAQSTPSNTPARSSFTFPPPPSSAGVPITWTRPAGSCDRTAASAAPAPAPDVAMMLCPHACPIVGQRVVLAHDRDRGAVTAPLHGRPERGGHAADPALDLEPLGLEERAEPAGGLDLLVAELRVVVDLPGQRLELAGEAVDGALDVGLEGAHGSSSIGMTADAAGDTRGQSGA